MEITKRMLKAIEKWIKDEKRKFHCPFKGIDEVDCPGCKRLFVGLKAKDGADLWWRCPCAEYREFKVVRRAKSLLKSKVK